jgi:hypothetical protein
MSAETPREAPEDEKETEKWEQEKKAPPPEGVAPEDEKETKEWENEKKRDD